MIRFKTLKQSLRHAFEGLSTVFRHEHSFRVQLFFGLLAIGLGLYVRLTPIKMTVILMMVASVLILEVVNSIFERISDAFKPRLHPIVKEVKDMMAGAVLLASIFSVIVGVLIFYPYVQLLVSP